MATHDQFTRITTAPQGANLYYLPTANIAPMPRRSNVGRLPKGVARFKSHAKRRHSERDAIDMEIDARARILVQEGAFYTIG